MHKNKYTFPYLRSAVIAFEDDCKFPAEAERSTDCFSPGIFELLEVFLCPAGVTLGMVCCSLSRSISVQWRIVNIIYTIVYILNLEAPQVLVIVPI